MAVFGDVRAFCARRVALKEGERVEFELQEVRSWLDLRLFSPKEPGKDRCVAVDVRVLPF